MSKLQLSRPLAFFDLETTGINVATDRIVEIAIYKIMPDGNTHLLRELVNPGRPIPQEAADIHKITDEMVADKPKFEELAKKIFLFLEDSDLAGYNSNRFDVPMLVEEFLRADMDFTVDERKLIDVQRIFHTMEKRTLEAAVKFYTGKTLENAHSAEADTIATYEVLLGQLEKYEGEVPGDVDELSKWIGDDNFVDSGRRIVMKDGIEVFNFGKHKGKSVEQVLSKEPSYYNWMMDSDFLLDTKRKLSAIRDRIRKQGSDPKPPEAKDLFS